MAARMTKAKEIVRQEASLVVPTPESQVVAHLRSILTDSRECWEEVSVEARPLLAKFLNARSEKSAIDRLGVVAVVNRCLPWAMRCRYAQAQAEWIENKIQYPTRAAQLISKRKPVSPDAAIAELLTFYREVWGRFEEWERRQSVGSKTAPVTPPDALDSLVDDLRSELEIQSPPAKPELEPVSYERIKRIKHSGWMDDIEGFNLNPWYYCPAPLAPQPLFKEKVEVEEGLWKGAAKACPDPDFGVKVTVTNPAGQSWSHTTTEIDSPESAEAYLRKWLQQYQNPEIAGLRQNDRVVRNALRRVGGDPILGTVTAIATASPKPIAITWDNYEGEVWYSAEDIERIGIARSRIHKAKQVLSDPDFKDFIQPANPAQPVDSVTQPDKLAELKLQRSDLMKRIDQIRKSGEVAPAGAEFDFYRQKRVNKDGTVAFFPAEGYYWKVKHKQPIFQNKGKAVKSLHLGTAEDARKKDWDKRMHRRREIKWLESALDKVERKIQQQKD